MKTITTALYRYILTPILITTLTLLAGCIAEEPEEASNNTGATAIAFEGARIITGDGNVIDSGTLIVEADRIVAVGADSAIDSAIDTSIIATVVDVSGATIMPMMIDTHVHLNVDRDALIEDLRSRARFGVSAAMSLGMDGEDEVLVVREELIPDAARYFTAGRGITRPEPGRTEVPHWVNTPAEAREAVKAEASRGVDIIKIWVDDRNAQYEKMTPDLYQAVIDEAHANELRVTAHIFNLSDAKGLLEANIDAFAHGVRDRDVDDSFMEIIQTHPDLVLVPNLPYRGIHTDYDWMAGMVDGELLQQLKSQGINPQAQESFGIQARNLDRMNKAGVRIALGTDGNRPYGAHIEIEDMVIAGMSAMEAIVAATANGAEFLGMDDAGTLTVGKSADFIILDDNPLDDITNTRKIRDVYLRGEKIER